MKKSFEEVMDAVDFKDLLKMKKDLENGGQEINRIVERKIKEEIKKHDIHCITCTGRIIQESENNFSLSFGPEGMRRRASFCGIDCMEYFIRNLKQLIEMRNEEIGDIPDLDESGKYR